MALWLETKYINLISNQFSVFKRKTDKLYNVRCPDCGDSRKNKLKARGYFFERDAKWFYKCHNCGYSATLVSFMKKHTPQQYKEYLVDTVREGETKGELYAKPQIPKSSLYGTKQLKLVTKVSSLYHSHLAKNWIVDRKIPNKYHAQLFYTDNFTKFTNTLIPDKLAYIKNDKRIIIPLIDERNNLFGMQGRALYESKLRYITILLDESRPKVFGLNNVDKSKKVYVFEGPFDSMFVDNSLAVCGSDIIQALSGVKNLIKENIVIVYDNEPRSSIINKKIDTAIDSGYNVVIWPQNVKQKDVNDMITHGMTEANLKLMLDVNTYKGLNAKLALTAYRK